MWLKEQVGGGFDLGFVVGIAIPGDFGELGEVDESHSGGVEAKLLEVKFEPAFGEGCFPLRDGRVLFGDVNVKTFIHLILTRLEPVTDFGKIR